MMSRCVGYTPRKPGLKINCANCKRWTGTKCLDRELLDELYEESPEFKAADREMRSNRGVRIG